MRFSVEYKPPITKHAERFIRAEITASMTSEDGGTRQYRIDFVLENLEKEKDDLFKHDITYLKSLPDDNVAYIEI